jgi:uncharacterized membrane protein YccF (DUF307 family)
MLPFGQRIVYMPASTYTTISNLIWLPLGVVLAIHHLIWAGMCFVTIIGIPCVPNVFLMCSLMRMYFMTIIGIPFAIQCFPMCS